MHLAGPEASDGDGLHDLVKGGGGGFQAAASCTATQGNVQDWVYWGSEGHWGGTRGARGVDETRKRKRR